MSASTNVAEVLSLLIGDMSEATLAELVNVPKATINRLLSGRTPDPRASTLIPIADYFGITIDQLLGKEPLPADIPLKRFEKAKNETLVTIPFIEMDKLMDWKNGKYIPKTFYEIAPTNAGAINQESYLTMVTNEVMAPKFNNGIYLIINRTIEPKNDDYGIFIIGNDDQATYFRKLIIEGNQRYLYALHPGFEVLGPFQNIEHLGSVVEARFLLK